jgi:hypothetical protein
MRINTSPPFSMSPLDALWHLLGLFMPALLTGLLATAMAKAVWRRELAQADWWRLARWPIFAGALALLGGLVAFGRDGRMASYALMLLASALALWWAGFGRRTG